MRPLRILFPLLAVTVLLACTSQEEKIAKHRAAANEYFEAEKWSEAKIEFLNLLQLEPDNAEAHFKMGETLWNLEDYGEALWQYNETARLAPDNIEWRKRAAQAEFTARRYDSAMEHVTAVLEADPRNVEALLLRGGLKSVKGDLDALMEDVDRALEIDPEDKSALALKAQGLARLGDSVGAEEYMRRLIKIDGNMNNHLSLARYLAVLSRPVEALAEIEAAVEAAGDQEERTQALFFLANFHLNQRDTESAEKVLLQAQAETPENPRILQTLATFYYSQGNQERAEQMLEENVKQHPDDVQPLLVLAEFHRRLGGRDKALETIQRALDEHPESDEARLRRSELLVEPVAEGEQVVIPEESWQIVREVLENNPKSTQGLFNQGKFLLLEGKYEDAATSLRRVIDEQPTGNAHVLLGSAYMALSQDDLARSEFLQALQRDAQNNNARTQLALLYLRTGENELAAREARTGLARSPADLTLRMTLAEALVRLNNQSEASDVLRDVTLPDDLNFETKMRFARLYRRAGRRQEAKKLLEGMLLADPKSDPVRAEIVGLNISARQPDKAIARLNEWIETDPDNALLYDLRGRVGLTAMRPRDAEAAVVVEADLKKGIEMGAQGTQPLISLAELYRSTGRIDEAIKMYEKARETDPQNAAVPLQLAVLQEGMGRLDEAKANYEAVLRLDQSQPEAKNNLAWLLANAENPDEKDLDRALALAQDAKEALPGNPSVTDTLGWIMYKKGIPSAAISLFREAIEGYPEAHPLRGTVRFHLAKSYERNGETGRAITELKRALDEVTSFNEREEAKALLAQLEKS